VQDSKQKKGIKLRYQIQNHIRYKLPEDQKHLKQKHAQEVPTLSKTAEYQKHLKKEYTLEVLTLNNGISIPEALSVI
jgi:hypothetical protein